MRLLKWIPVVTIFLATVAAPVFARTRPARKAPGCQLTEFHELDFWIGKWRVVKPDESASASVTVAPVLRGCALSETWIAERGNDGRGLSTYNPANHKWEYFWVAANGYTSFWTGEFAGNAMRFTAAQPSPGAAALRRWNLIKLSDGRIEEEALFSRDSGKTWLTQYMLYWERIQ